MPHAFITIAIPFNAEFVGETAETVKRIGNPFGATFRAKLAKSGIVHFASLTIVPPQPSGQSAHLVIEMSADGDADQAIGALADALGHISQMLSMPPASTGPPRTLRRSSPTRATG